MIGHGELLRAFSFARLDHFDFLPAIIELVQELLISNMHNKLEEDTCENVEVIAPTRSNY